jgi:hypothetical protein
MFTWQPANRLFSLGDPLRVLEAASSLGFGTASGRQIGGRLLHESSTLVARAFGVGLGQHCRLSGIHRMLRANLREPTMIYVTALITALLFIYLGTALVRPEWF